jgi:Beta-lactamase enzyme family
MAFALLPELPADVHPPALVAPAAREVSFGRIAGTVSPGTARVVVLVNGEKSGERRVRGTRFRLNVEIPPRDSTVRVVALDAFGDRAKRSVQPVFGLPHAALAPTSASYEDPALKRRIEQLTREFDGISGIYVENLRTGAGAAWNAKARFPAASSVKIAIAIEVLRVLDARPPPGSSLDRLLELMLVRSDNAAANELLAWLGGSETAGTERVNETVAALGLGDTHLYGGYLTSSARTPIPLTIESQPSFEGKYTTAWDLAQLHRFLHLAALGRGPLVTELEGAFTPADARFLLYLLVHSEDHGKLDRYLGGDVVVPHKAGWVSEARHDSGLVYSRDGVFVASVMTWTGGGAGEPSDELAGRVAAAALETFASGEPTAELARSFSLLF